MNSPQDRVALVVDDHDAVRRALCDRIQASFAGCHLRQAGTVDEALKIVDAEPVDIVLMDFRLPGTDGVVGTRLVLERSPKTFVVMVSAYDDLSHRSAARKAGAMAFVSKRAIGRELIPLMEGLISARP
jgi:DNA-binding NarL/FixJ family response regulator